MAFLTPQITPARTLCIRNKAKTNETATSGIQRANSSKHPMVGWVGWGVRRSAGKDCVDGGSYSPSCNCLKPMRCERSTRHSQHPALRMGEPWLPTCHVPQPPRLARHRLKRISRKCQVFFGRESFSNCRTSSPQIFFCLTHFIVYTMANRIMPTAPFWAAAGENEG